jgi:hypothetical protein
MNTINGSEKPLWLKPHHQRDERDEGGDESNVEFERVAFGRAPRPQAPIHACRHA